MARAELPRADGGDWRLTRDEDPVTEWRRADGYASVRMRRRPDGTWVVRYDRLTQAPRGSAFRQRSVPSEEDARALAGRWRTAEPATDGP